jgi:hypothetical protein
LIAIITGLVAAEPPRGASLAPLLADHQAHAAALQTLLNGYAATPGSTAAAGTSATAAGTRSAAVGAGGSPASAGASSPTLAALLAASRQAATAGQQAAAVAPGELAPLLASIAACEAGHVHLLAPS